MIPARVDNWTLLQASDVLTAGRDLVQCNLRSVKYLRANRFDFVNDETSQ